MFAKVKKMLLFTLVFLVVAIISLEILSRTKECKISASRPNCPLSVSDSLQGADPGLTELRQKRFSGEEISKEEYRLAADKLILEVDPNKMGYLNGVACGSTGYVRNDLPREVKKFVKRHELEHLLQTGGGKNKEFSANLAAGKEYPVGLLQTAVFSLVERTKFYGSPACYLATTWKTFKIYSLP